MRSQSILRWVGPAGFILALSVFIAGLSLKEELYWVAARVLALIIGAISVLWVIRTHWPPGRPSTTDKDTPAELPRDTMRPEESKPSPGPIVRAPTSLGSFMLRVTDRAGKTHEFANACIRYPSSFGPSSEKRGIRVRQGTVQSFVEWSSVKGITFGDVHSTIAGKVKYRYDIEILFRDGSTATAEVVEDWNMSAGHTGLLFGQTPLGKSQLKFTDIYSIAVASSRNAG